MLFHLKSQSAALSIDLALLENEILANSNTGRGKFADGFFTADGTAGTGGRAKFASGFVDTGLLGAAAVTAAKADLTGTWNFSSGTLRAADPLAANDVATKSYVESIAAGIRDWKDSVKAATTAALATDAIVGNVLTASANGFFAGATGVDTGPTYALNDRILVKNQASGLENGIYTITNLGSGASKYTLTRATDADTSAEVTAGMTMWVTEGSTNGDTGWLLTTNDTINLNTTVLTFVQFNSGGTTVYVGGAGITQSGSGTVTFDVVAADNSIVVNANDLQVKRDTGATTGNIVITGSAGITADTATSGGLETAANKLQIKDLGVTFARLATAVAARLGRYDRREDFRSSTSLNLDLAVSDADQTSAGILVYKNGQLLDPGAGTPDYTLSDNGGTAGVDRIVIAAGVGRLTTDVFTAIYKRVGADI